MILLSGHSLTPARKVPMETLSLQLKERESTATMSPTDMSGIGVNSWFKDDTEPGKGIVWRVKSIANAYHTQTPTVQLEHVINTLRDRIMFGEITTGTLAGNANATTVSAYQAVRYILSYQSDWVLGEFGYSVSNPYKFDGDSLFDALETVTASLRDACWTYNMDVYPFRLNIVPKPSGVGSELRAGRNLKTISKTIDKSQMYTRFYPIGKDDLHVDGDCVDRNTSLYGVVAKCETDASIDSKDELWRWANERLDNHAEPTVTIDVEGFELADATGESLDKLTLGRICRIPLPEFGTTIQERITALNYQDKIHQPSVVRVTLANNREDVTKIIADAIKKGTGGKGGRTSTKQSKEDHAWFEDTNEHVAMCAIGIIGTDAKGNPNWVRLSELVVDGEGIHAKVQSVQKDLVIAQTRIEENEYAIRLEADRRLSADQAMHGELVVQADLIKAEVEERKAEGVALSGRIQVNAGKVGMVVETKNGQNVIKAASICVAINQSGDSAATINADKIYLLGQTIANTITADYIQTKIASLATLNVASIKSERGTANMYGLKTTTFEQGGVTCYVPNAVWNLQITQSGNTYKLQRKRFNDDAWVDVGSFSRATSLSGSWSGGIVTISASPQGNSWYSAIKSLAAGDITWNGNIASFDVKAYNNGSETAINTGRSMSLDATARYNQGMLDYYSNSHGYWKTPTENNGVCKIPNSTNTGSETWFTMSKYTLAKGYNTDDTVYYGKLYKSDGTALTSNSYFWYGSDTNFGGANPVVYR